MMKLSDDMLNVMKNFSSINSSILLKKGNVQRSISPDKSILVEAEFSDDIPSDFGIYDLNQFLGNITTLNNPDVTFNTSHVVMNDNDGFKLLYMSCSPTLIISPPDKELAMKKVDATFTINSKILNKMMKLSSMNNFTNLSLVGKEGKINALVSDKSNDTTNHVMTELGDYTGEDFDVTFKIDNLKLIPDDYDVEVMVAGFAKFTSKNRKLKYFVALEAGNK
jgi:hypothetical protein